MTPAILCPSCGSGDPRICRIAGKPHEHDVGPAWWHLSECCEDAFHSQKVQLSSREKTERALGRAAHPAAIERLYEIFPEAEVEVRHGGMRKRRFTTVTLSTPDGDVLANTQWTYPPLQWDRRRSLKRTFHCLLKDICERTNEADRAFEDTERAAELEDSP